MAEALLTKPSDPKVLWRPHEGPQTEFMSRLEDFVLYGGSKGPGKTDGLIFEALRQVNKPGYKALLIRRNFPQLQEMLDRAHKYYPQVGGKWSGTNSRFEFPSGAYIRFGHCQHEKDKENYQGQEFAFIGFDQLEQFTESQFNFIMAQNRSAETDMKCYARGTANPGGVGHWWLKRRFMDGKKPGVSYKQTFDLPDGRKVTRTWCFIRATIYDNPTLLKAQPTYLANLMSLPEADRKAYLEGDWGIFSSQSIFDAHGMSLQETKVRDPEWTGFLREFKDSYQIIADSTGELKIWQQPKDDCQYEIGGDVAEGAMDGDYSSAHVVNKKTWEVVAHWHGFCDPFQFAHQLYKLGLYYKRAELAPEINGPGLATLTKLVELGYPVIYEYDLGKKGFRTDLRTRHNLISTLQDSVRDGSVKIYDRDTMDEMYNFIRNPGTGKFEARENCFDDRVMSLGIALQCIRLNPVHDLPEKKKRVYLGRNDREKEGSRRRSSTGYRG